MEKLLGAKNFPYYSGAITYLLMSRYYHLQLFCGAIGLLHLVVERLYLGKSPQRWWVTALVGIIFLAVLGTLAIQPRLQQLNFTQFSPQFTPENRQTAHRSYTLWRQLYYASNIFTLAALGFYLWRMANPPESTRFWRGKTL
jgi:hypothetical protein